MDNFETLFSRLNQLGIRYDQDKYSGSLFEYACRRCEAEGKVPKERPVYVKSLMLAHLTRQVQNCEAIVTTFGKSCELRCPSESEMAGMIQRELQQERKGRK